MEVSLVALALTVASAVLALQRESKHSQRLSGRACYLTNVVIKLVTLAFCCLTMQILMSMIGFIFMWRCDCGVGCA